MSIEVPADGTYVLDTGSRPAAMIRCLTRPAPTPDLIESEFPVQDDWQMIEPLEALSFAYGWEADEVWADLSLPLAADTYEIWVYRDPDEAAYLPKPDQMSLRRL